MRISNQLIPAVFADFTKPVIDENDAPVLVGRRDQEMSVDHQLHGIQKARARGDPPDGFTNGFWTVIRLLLPFGFLIAVF